ncbi:MAG TPA: RES domain-containing protein, partial [Woeseiaceae bacterium]|nr:RES domain-containing protein [Woeseiaceae bacterium]
AWRDPLDPSFAAQVGGRWNPARSFPTLYLNEDKVTARLNLRAFIAGWPYEPEDLRPETGPVLVGATLPRHQEVCDLHTPAGVHAAGLPKSYPLDGKGQPVPRSACQPIGARARKAGLRGVRSRSARSRDGAGRDVAWFPAGARSAATRTIVLAFDRWYWS